MTVLEKQLEKHMKEIEKKIELSETAEEIRTLNEDWKELQKELYEIRTEKEDIPPHMNPNKKETTHEQSEDKIRSIGETFAKKFTERFKGKEYHSGMNLSMEYSERAATDPITIGTPISQTSNLYALLTEVDTNIVLQYRRPLVTDLFNQSGISTSSITYYKEGNAWGNITGVIEAGQKPQI